MRTPLVLLAVAAVALGPAASAPAKEIASVKLCGAGGCRDVTDRATHAAVDGGPLASAPETASPFYRVKVRIKADGGRTVPGWSSLWVRAAGRLQAGDGTWMEPGAATVAGLKRLTRGLEPLPASRLRLPPAVVAPPPTGAPAPAAPPADGGLPAAVWALIAAGALGLAYTLARAGAALAARRRGAAPAG